MLGRAKSQRTLPADVLAYLRETLGVDAQVRQWSGARKLPYFLQDTFDLHELQLRDRKILLASGRKERLPALRTLRIQLDKLADMTERPIVFAAKTLASYERKRLVEQKVPFVVPGNQLYLPDLGIDFREYFRQPQKEVTAFSPATQAIFIAALLHEQWEGEWKAAELIAKLGNAELRYTAMTLSRVARELTAAGLVSANRERRTRYLKVNHSPPQAWAHAAPFLRSPVKRTFWVDLHRHAKSISPPLAGLSALANYTMLADPAYRTEAVGPGDWKAAQQPGIQLLPAPQPEARQWQVWTYTPKLKEPNVVVDPLSLTLSLKDEKDARVEKSLEELESQFPW
jgi:hypothetical protein